MTSSNKLNRAFDSLKRIVSKSSDEINRQKLKLTPCLTITELVCKSNEKNTLLPVAVTSLIQLLEDADSNTRLVIDECLNKIIRCSIDNSNHVAKILIALLKVLGKGTNERCLRAALWRLGKLAHYIRPQKGKIYVKTLVPVIVKLAGRKEESIHETLADSLPSILKHIGLFSADHDSRILLKAFFRNLNSDSIEIRRAAAFSIITVCEFSRKPQLFFSYSLATLLDFLYDSQHLDGVNKTFVQGCLSCIRQILPCFTHYVNDQLSINNDATIEKLFQVYEQCLFFAKFRDHNVTTAALETLHQLLQQTNSQFIKKLTSAGGLSKSTMCKQDKLGSTLSLSAQSDVLSISSTIAQTEDGIFSDGLSCRKALVFGDNNSSSFDLNEEPKQERTEKWLHDQSSKDGDAVSSSSLLNINVSHFANSDDEETPCEVDLSLSSSFRAVSVDNIQKMSDDGDNMCGRAKLKSQSVKSVATLSTISGSLNTASMELDIGDPVDDNDIPMNYCSRFLTSMFLLESPGRHVRVSVMSLALSCLSQLLKIYPAGGLISIERGENVSENYNSILEAIIVHVSHEDQQIRGFVRIVIGNFIASSLIADDYLHTKNEHVLLHETLLTDMITFLLQGLVDESSICVKHSLHGISLCLESLLLSSEFKRVIPVFDVIFTLVDNPYWLIKIKILEMLGDLPYELLYYISDNSSIIQNRIFEKVIVILLSDVDGRVRNAASQSLSKFVKNAYYPLDHQFESVVVTYTKKLNSKLVTSYAQKSNSTKKLVADALTKLQRTFLILWKTNRMLQSSLFLSETERLSCEERSLCRVVHLISQILADTSSKNTIAGCCEALSVLAVEYRPAVYPFGWQCWYYEKLADSNTSYTPLGLFDNLLALMTNTSLILNFDVHLSILKILSELFIALCKSNLISKQKMSRIELEGIWSFLADQKLAQLAESFLQHLMRLASIFNDTVTNVTVKSQASSKWNATSDFPLPVDEPLFPKPSPEIDLQHLKQPIEKVYGKREEKPHSFSQYNHVPWYMKLREAIKSAYNNYEVTLKPESSEKFILFLKTIMEIFSAVLEFTTVSEVDRICKDLLHFLRNFMVFLPAESTHCVMQLLKSVFGTNTIADHFQSFHLECCYLETENSLDSEGFYRNCFQRPYDEIAKVISNGSKIQNKVESHKEWVTHRNEPESLIMKPSRRNVNLSILPSYIKLFEPNVIQSLRHYTVTSDTTLQAEVLYLLSELIQLKVNYCLLDSEQVFIKFVLSQFQLIEEEQLLNVDRLLPALFNFLIHLASEKHSKPVMTVPKVIQLCDSLIAGVQTIFHCVIAIEPVVHHVFLKSSVIANTNEIKELETQRDVLFTMLLKLIHNSRTMKLLTMVLNNSDDEIKLRRSNQIADILLTALERCKISVENDETNVDILNLLLTLHPASFSGQRLLNIIFNIYHANKLNEPSSWIPFLTSLLLVLLAKYDEIELLTSVGQMLKHPVFVSNDEITIDPLCVNAVEKSGITPAQAFVQFICENMKLLLQSINDTKLTENSSCDYVSWKTKMLSEILSIVSYIIKSGRFKALKNELILKAETETNDENVFLLEIDRISCLLLVRCPPVVLRWYELVLHLQNSYGYFGHADSALIISKSLKSVYNAEIFCLSDNIVKLGLFLLVCEHQNEFIDNSEILRVVIQDNFDVLLDATEEPVVQELLSNIQKSEIASTVLMDVVNGATNKLLKCNKKLRKVLRCMKFCHIQTSGQVMLFCCQPEILNNCIPVSDSAVVLINQCIQYLLEIDDRENFERQLKNEDFQSIVKELKRTMSPKLRELLDPLCQLAAKWYDVQLLPVSSNRRLDIDRIRSASTDKQWFFNLVKHMCCNQNETRYYSMAVLLGYLPLQDIFSIMRSQHFNNKILRYSFSLGTQLNLQWEAETGQMEVEFSNLFLASRLAVFRHIEHIRSLLPKTHQVYIPLKREANKKETQYKQRMDSVFSDKEFVDTIRCLIPAVHEYLSSVAKLVPKVELQVVIASNTFKNLVDFAVLCLEMVHWFILSDRHWSKVVVIDALKCCSSVLKVQEIMATVTSSHIGSIISALYTLVENCTRDSIKYSPNPRLNDILDNDLSCIYHSSHLASTLIEYFITKVPIAGHSSASVVQFSRALLVILTQSSLMYDYVRIPLEIWKHVSKEDVVIRSCLTLNTISENFLQDSDILENFVSRLMFVGWNCRMQFEECWMSLLIALNSLPEYESSDEEIIAVSQVHAVTISAVTSLLVQTMYHPTPGCKTAPDVFHVSRNNIDCDETRWRLKLESVNDLFITQAEIKNENVFCLFNNININVERLHNKNLYDFNQISIEYLAFCCENNLGNDGAVKSSVHRKSVILMNQQRQSAVKEIGVDTNSCVYFLMDLYSRWLLKPDGQTIQILLEIVNSLLVISDLFTEITQFAWLLESGLILWKKCFKDDVVCSYLVVIICKAASMFVPADSDSKKLVSKILKSGLNHINVTVRTASLHGLLYLLESIFKKSVLNQNEAISGLFESEILSMAVVYVLENLDIDLSEIYKDKTVNCVISVAYYLVENNSCGDNVDIIIDRLLKLSVRACKLKRWQIYVTVIQSLYNLILSEHSNMKKFDNELRQLVKEILSTLECTPAVAILSLQLLVALMYASGDFGDTRIESPDEIFDTEKLITRMDNISVFFDRIKKSGKVEAQFISSILPQILNDLFPASEILNKIILEFVSPQQPYPELLAKVVFKVFQNAIHQSHIILIQDWVLSLLNNFSNYPIPQAVFYLTCFFISACENAWLTASFPSVRFSRSPEVEYEDRKLLCMSAAYFYSQLKEESQKSAFISTFRAAEKKHPDSPFSDVLLTIS